MRYVITTRNMTPQTALNGLFDDFFPSSSSVKIPPVDVYETKEGYVIEAEIAGYGEGDVSVVVHNNVITLSSDESWRDKLRKRMEERHLVSSEIRLPEFSSSFSLPSDAAADRIEAETRNGILYVSIPKKAKKESGKIEISIR